MKCIRRGLVALLLCLSMLFLWGCEKEGIYKEERSSLKDRKVMAKVGDYKVRYELMRALFYTVKDGVDNGDDSVWSSEQADEYFDAAMVEIESALRQIYGTFAHLEACGIDPFGDDIDELVYEYVRKDIEGGYANNNYITGYGSKDAYLKALEDRHFTDAANRILYRMAAASSVLHDYYLETYADGSIAISDDMIKNFLLSDDCIHVHWVYIERNSHYTDAQQQAYLDEVWQKLKALEGSPNILQLVITYGYNLAAANLENGFYITETTMGSTYRPIVEAAKTLSPYEVSSVVECADGYYILVGLQKNADDLLVNSVYKEVTNLYITNQLYTDIDLAGQALDITYKKAFDKYRGKKLD